MPTGDGATHNIVALPTSQALLVLEVDKEKNDV
jgi:hypothetical protein